MTLAGPPDQATLNAPVSRWPAILAPTIIGVLALAGWSWLIRSQQIPSFLLPGPVTIVETLVRDWDILAPALLVTLRTTAAALLLAVALGVALAILFAQWKWLERSLFPYAVILQVTPVVSI